MKKNLLRRILAMTIVFIPLLFGGSLQGSNGAQVSGGACSKQSNVPPSDIDSDGIPDELDNCPGDYNPNQNDSDGNGVGEICEAFEPFDGQITCELPACDSAEECQDALDDLCPQDAIELNFLGLALNCCDRACAVTNPESEILCPADSCPEPFVHCSSDEDCSSEGLGPCVEGCCMGFVEEPAPCECVCPVDDPGCVCPPCEEPGGEPPPPP
ncbi:MAG: hypothetical protein U1F66_04830 [bacterium]